MAVLGYLTALSLVLQFGFHLPLGVSYWMDLLDIVLCLGFVALWQIEVVRSGNILVVMRRRLLELILLIALLAFAMATLWMPDLRGSGGPNNMHAILGESVFIAMRLFLLGCVCIQCLRGIEWLFSTGWRFELLFALSFVLAIVVGTLLLLLPRAAADPAAPVPLMDAIFTATSAVCVTGLVVRDTGVDFSLFGQSVILCLLQVGGLGIIMLVAVVSSLSSKTLPLPQLVAFQNLIPNSSLTGLRRRILGVVALTVIIEALGALLLFVTVPLEGSIGQRLFWCIFHSSSAFCNAGFALQSDSLMFLRYSLPANYIIMGLIILGGLGFLVLPELLQKSRFWIRHFSARVFGRRRQVPALAPRLSIQTRLSLLVTGLLLFFGAVVFYLLESSGTLANMTFAESLTAVLFQSVTSRTAGFNTLPIGEFQNSALILVMMLMVVGASPVSTGGGIKTLTLAVLALSLRAMANGRESIEVFGRALPPKVVIAALNIFLLYTVSAAMGLLLLTACDASLTLRDGLFETISALSTVGLSTGVTANISTGGQLVLCALMFVGRVGPIIMVLAVFQSSKKANYSFPTENLVVG